MALACVPGLLWLTMILKPVFYIFKHQALC